MNAAPIVFSAIALMFWSTPIRARADEQPAASQRAANRVRSLLARKCLGCHGEDPKEIEGELDLRSRAGLLAGGESGQAAIVPGKPEKSPLYVAVTWKNEDLQMPPKARNRLSDDEVALVRRWIEDGAPWPDRTAVADAWKDAPAGGVTVKTSGGLSADWTNRRYQPRDLWAYRPVQDAPVPKQSEAGGKKVHPVDAFIQERLSQIGLVAAPRADRLTLIRRATYDLTGLPPTPDQIDEFLDDTSPQAFRKLVDRLLDSPRYGERWAQHWLDVVRYADTAGFSNDFERPNAWRYRDYVIRSFNDDKPYDEFVVEQIAGDELYERRKDEGARVKHAELLIAVGFLRMGPWEHTGMSVAAVTRQQFLDDVTNSVGLTFLATGMSCFKCHDHKFDPLPTRDYYRMQAVFAPLQFVERPVPFLPQENMRGMKEGRLRVERLTKEDVIKLHVPSGATQKQIDEGKLGVAKIKNKRRQVLNWWRNRYKPLALSVYSGPNNNYASQRPLAAMPKHRTGKVAQTHILTGGSLESPGQSVTPGVLSVVSHSSTASVPDQMQGRRLALARWIASPDNPLTGRVMVNRIWQFHFGRGLAANANNFGKMGGKPSHPALLDWLATRFVESGWSIKTMHRLIMNSAAYQRSTAHPDPDKLSRLDPKQQLLAAFRPRRLTAEELRDSLLAVSGELNAEMGGLPIRPEINMEIAMQPRHIMGSVAPAYQPSRTPDQRNRRTIYALRIRTLRDPMLEVFNQPDPDVSCELRDATTVTPQVFSLFNAQASHDRALATAVRLEKETDNPAKRVDNLFRLAFGRRATDAERERCLAHVQRMTDHHREHKPQVVEPPKVIVREMVEEMTGLNFQWTEKLDIYQDYIADTKPWNVTPEVRAWADLCLVIFNANEFVYVY